MDSKTYSLQNYFLNELENRRTESGGVARLPGCRGDIASTAWALWALNNLEQDRSTLLLKGKEYLRLRQLDDGSVPLNREVPDSVWPTPIALLAWNRDGNFHDERAKAIDFLLNSRGIVIRPQPDHIAHDTSMIGWPWIRDTYSWVEPTSFAIAALKTEGKEKHKRIQQGISLLLDRMFEEGGWNYGNKKIFGNRLIPMLESTGIALFALRESVSESDVKPSLHFLESHYPETHTPLSLARLILGLSSFGRCPSDVTQKIEHCLTLQNRYGPFETTLLAELAIALSETL